jgi:hypothetical protein
MIGKEIAVSDQLVSIRLWAKALLNVPTRSGLLKAEH